MKTILFALLTTFSLHATQIDRDKLSETLGHLIVRHLVNPEFEFNLEKMIQGIEDERAGKAAPLSDEEYEKAIFAIQENLFSQAAEKNLAAALSFLQQNKSNEGVVSVDEKLQYKISHVGEGDEVGPTSTPLVHYQGHLLDGTPFASSLDAGEPITLPIARTIPGFAKGLVGMREGEKRTLYIHPELTCGVAGHLPPNSLLIFEVEVVQANAPEEAVAEK